VGAGGLLVRVDGEGAVALIVEVDVARVGEAGAVCAVRERHRARVPGDVSSGKGHRAATPGKRNGAGGGRGRAGRRGKGNRAGGRRRRQGNRLGTRRRREGNRACRRRTGGGGGVRGGGASGERG